jgi:hypothetical protein
MDFPPRTLNIARRSSHNELGTTAARRWLAPGEGCRSAMAPTEQFSVADLHLFRRTIKGTVHEMRRGSAKYVMLASAAARASQADNQCGQATCVKTAPRDTRRRYYP